MLSEAIVVGVTGVLVASINVWPQFKNSKKLDKLTKKVDDIDKYIKNDKDENEVSEKMKDIQSYYINKVSDEKLKSVGIMKSNSFIKLTTDFMNSNFNDINQYQAFQNHLFTGSRYCRIKMAQVLGNELTEKYYSKHDLNTMRYNTIIQKIFFTTENSKKNKFISASVDFMQLFMTELICLVNGKEKTDQLDECSQQARRCDDHK